MENHIDQEFVEYVVKKIVDLPEKVVVSRRVDDLGVLISVDLDPSDMSKVIGRSGATVKAIRSLLRVIGAKNNARVNLKVNEPEGSTFVPARMRMIDPLEDIKKDLQ